MKSEKKDTFQKVPREAKATTPNEKSQQDSGLGHWPKMWETQDQGLTLNQVKQRLELEVSIFPAEFPNHMLTDSTEMELSISPPLPLLPQRIIFPLSLMKTSRFTLC